MPKACFRGNGDAAGNSSATIVNLIDIVAVGNVGVIMFGYRWPGRVLRGRTVTTQATAVLLTAVLATPAAMAAGRVSGPADVVDGDGLRIGPVAIRLYGIDAPELGQRCAAQRKGTWQCDEAAADRLADLVMGGDVDCEPLDRDAYGRIVARCSVEGVDVAETLVSEGLVWAFRRYSADYVSLEEDARSGGRGIWQAPTEAPWDYRANHWERAAAEAPDGCPIKGNINAEGEQIYHTPWSPWYGRTKISEASGERWFCDETEAVAAGWRAARFR